MSRIIEKLFPSKKVEEPPFDMRDVLVPLQQLVNVIYDRTEEHGTDITHWSMYDLIELCDTLGRFDKKEGK